MKEIIPLKKDIIFKTKIGEITNINLDYDYKLKDNLIEGNVIVYGTYKMTPASVIDEEFTYKIPFLVSITKNVIKDSIKIDIDDFKYEVNKDVLSVNIDLEFSCDEEDDINDLSKDILNDLGNDIKIDAEETIDFDNIETTEEKEISVQENNTNIDIDENINNITNNIIDTTNNYYTYKVYIVKENDTMEQICSKYNVTINDIKEYNQIDSIKEGDKIIIPYINE